MITYFVDTTTDPASPRLMRQINGQPANAVAFEIEAFRLTYDLADGVTNPVGVRMDADRPGRGWRLHALGLLAEPDPQGQRDAGDPLGEAERQRRVLPQHAVHAGGAAQPGVRGPLQLSGAMTCFGKDVACGTKP